MSDSDQAGGHAKDHRLTWELLPSFKTEQSTRKTVAIVEQRTLSRECLELCLTAMGQTVVSFASVDDLLKSSVIDAAAVVLFCTRAVDARVERGISLIAQMGGGVPSALLTDAENPDEIIVAFSKGVRGYVLTSTSLKVLVEVLRLVAAGGDYIPASSLIGARQSSAGLPTYSIFTARQHAVVEALCRGKSNKIIAHELCMCESTVKVHVRNIMKKLNARSRTQVACMIHDLLGGPDTMPVLPEQAQGK